MQDVESKRIKSIAFGIMCGSSEKSDKLKFCLERLNKLKKDLTTQHENNQTPNTKQNQHN